VESRGSIAYVFFPVMTKSSHDSDEAHEGGAALGQRQDPREAPQAEQAGGQALAKAQADLTALRKKLDAEIQRRRELEETLDRLKGSWSWRLMTPARISARRVFSLYHGCLGLRHALPSRISRTRRRLTLWLLESNPLMRRRRVRALKDEYAKRRLEVEPDTFVLYRIIGNDLHPRHKKGQSRENVKFILDNEPALSNCEKRWVVNRIIDPDEEAAIIALLEERRQPYFRIPFDMKDYRSVPWDFESFSRGFFLRGDFAHLDHYERARAEVRACRLKNNYLMNNNGARNAALRDGRGRAKWVLPWDGNCFVTEAGWQELTETISRQPYLKYFWVPMARIADNSSLLDPDFSPEATEEPQVVFRRDAEEEFNEAVPYGRRPKVELLWRLGVPGNWDAWPDDPWDLPRPERSKAAGLFERAGWVGRLFSGRTDLETATKTSLIGRGLARVDAISATIADVDVQVLQGSIDPNRLIAYDEDAIDALVAAGDDTAETRLLARLREAADAALMRGPYSVIDKTSLPPSGDRQDYWHPAPYWWPNPDTKDGLPYVWRDGERVPGTRLFEPDSDQYDRSRLQRLFDDTTVLALAWKATGHRAYADHGTTLLRRWFIDPESRMNPHLRYSQVRRGHNDDEGQSVGIIEMKDMYYFLDAVRMLSSAGALDPSDQDAFRSWLREYLDWLSTSRQGLGERQARNNHGTCYDLQVGAVAAFLGDANALRSTLRDSQERLLEQFEPDGRQPHEMTRTLTAHYVCFNLQSWANLALLAERCGQNLWDISAADGRGLRKGFEWLAPFMAGKQWKWPQVEPFDFERYWPLYYGYVDRYGPLPAPSPISAPPKLSVEPLFFPHDGIKPFWMLERARAPRDRP
jgi:alginate lyase